MPGQREPTSAGSDYSYDLAHDLADGRGPASGTAEPSEPHQTSPPPPADWGGDYSYDEAHDLP